MTRAPTAATRAARLVYLCVSFVSLQGYVLAGCVDVRVPTEAVVEISADPDLARDIYGIHVEIWGNDGEGTPFVLREERDVTEVAFPYTLSLAPRRRDALRAYRFTLVGTDELGRTVAVVRVHSGFMPNRRLRVPVRFESLCRGVICSDTDKTCRAGRCVSAYVPPTALPDFGAPSADGGLVDTCDRNRSRPLKARSFWGVLNSRSTADRVRDLRCACQGPPRSMTSTRG